MRVIGYVRVSTDEQATNGQSLDAQKAKIRAYAELYDLELVDIIEEAGVSAKKLDRAGLQRALEQLRRKDAEGLLIAKLDRLTRSVADWQVLINAYFGEKPGRQLFSVADSIDTRSASGRMILNLMLTIAQWEREIIGERTKDALQHKIVKGERCGKIRFGYDLSPDGRTLTRNATEQEAIGLMKELRATGQSYHKIAAALTARGISTKEGRQWQAMTVRGILRRAA